MRFSRKQLGIPYAVFLICFVIAPLLVVLYYAFTNGQGQFTVQNFVNFFTSENTIGTLVYSLVTAMTVTACCTLVAYPEAYILARSDIKNKNVLIVLYIAPMWINFTLRVVALKEVLTMVEGNLAYHPFLNTVLGMTYDFLPFMILPLYTTLEKLDKSYLEAAADLGASPVITFMKVTLPLSMPGLISGVTMVFLPSMTNYVILDMLYNQTLEGNHQGPTLCYRGIDNESYYTLDGTNKRYYYDSTGCGASFNLQNPYVLTLVMDSMRYMVEEMHVDGFRLDLATSLARVKQEFSQSSGFLMSLRQDEVLQLVKIAAEPWDVGIGGYQLGAFPPGSMEWNDRYRDVTRRFWRGDERQVGELASRLSGSSDIFGPSRRTIWSTVNYLTVHDGMTLNDLVSYKDKN